MGRKIDLGKVMVTLAEGPWSARTSYEILTAVYHNGDGYISKRDNIGVEPGSDDSVWYRIVRQGQIPDIKFDEQGNMYADDVLVTTAFADVIQRSKEAVEHVEEWSELGESMAEAENQRRAKEDERKADEDVRVLNEKNRQTAEANRTRNEAYREENERNRVLEESERETRFEEAMRQAASTMRKGDRGYSAYEVAVLEEGFVGSKAAWLASLVGPAGDSAYAIAVQQGYAGTKDQWLASLIGPQGKSAYQVAVDNGFEGTISEWLLSLKGAKGDPGKDITSIEQTSSSSESEGSNVITVTLSDGTAKTFTVKNGKRGLQGIPGVANAKYKQVAALPTASAATMDFIYLVESATAGVYNMSYTEEDAGAYSWKSLGTTVIQLADYATKQELSQLSKEFFKVTSTDEPYSSDDYTAIPFVITSPDTWASVSTSVGCRYRAVRVGQKVTITANATRATQWAFLAAEPSNITAGDTAVFADSTGLRTLNAGQTEEVIVPVDGYLYVRYRTATMNANYFPSSIVITTYTTENKIENWDNNTQEIAELQKKEIPTAPGNNLFDWRDANMGVVNATTGAITPSTEYWVTDFVPVDPTIGDAILVNALPFRIALYNSEKVFISVVTGVSLRTAIDISGVSFIVACFSNTNVPFATANKVFIYYAHRGDVTETKRCIDGGRISILDPQFFTIADVLPFASSQVDRTFTEDFTLVLQKGNQGNKNMIVSASAMFENNIDDAVPTIQFTYAYRVGYSDVYKSMFFTLGCKDFYEEKQWRLPPFPQFCKLTISVTIPANVTLYLESLENSFDNCINRDVPSYIFDGHGNGNVLKGFAKVARLGYPSCITVPKRTKDGVWVCFHDEVIGNSLVDANGNTPGSVGIWDLTYAELQTYTYPADYAGNKERVPTLEEYFSICARTGMRPMLSVHPTPTESEYREIKALAIRCGVLHQLELKPLASGEGVAFTVFGNEISAYILQANTISAAAAIARLNALGADTSKVRVGAEYFGDSAYLTEQGVADIVAAGYVVSLYAKSFTAEQYKYWMRLGVTEFTDSTNYSYGLNW